MHYLKFSTSIRSLLSKSTCVENGATIWPNSKAHTNRLVNGGDLPGLAVSEIKKLNGSTPGVPDEVNSIANN
jgi:hypothetical protein